MDREKLSRMQQQFAFLLEMDKEKMVTRQTPISDNSRKENDAEHAWHMAIFTLFMSEYANEEIDKLRTLSLVLCHDLVEIYAGDTYAYDEEGKASQAAREAEAAERLVAMLPPDQGEWLRGLWDEFEAYETPEAKFAHACDNIQPAMLNHATNGVSWEEHDINLSQILNRNARTGEGSSDMWEFSRNFFIEPHVQSGEINNK